MEEYLKIMADEELMKTLKNSGISQEQIEAWAREESGYDPSKPLNVSNLKTGVSNTMGAVAGLYKDKINNMFGGDLVKFFTDWGASYAKSLGDGFLKTFETVLTAIKGKFISLEKEIDTRLTAILTHVREVLDKGLELTMTIKVVLDMSSVEAGLGAMPSLGGGLNVSDSVNSALAAAASQVSETKYDLSGNPSANDGTTYNFTQNNYSPKALSATDIYRNTKNQFALLKNMG
jgi:hypothetical protein